MGSNSSTEHYGVKVFGIENYWGNQNRMIIGLINDENGILKVKLCKTADDGSTTTDYNMTGDGYIEVGSISGTNGGFIDKMYTDYGFLPKSLNGSSSTYYCGTMSYSNEIDFAMVGGSCYIKKSCGLYTFSFTVSTYSNWSTGASVSCKPLFMENGG